MDGKQQQIFMLFKCLYAQTNAATRRIDCNHISRFYIPNLTSKNQNDAQCGVPYLQHAYVYHPPGTLNQAAKRYI
jgi:hypothetical protein